MSSINISTLKDQLSAVLQRVRKGEEIVVTDRDRPVARLSPITHAATVGDDDSQLRELQQRGIILAASKARPTRRWIESHLVRGLKGSAVDALLQERDEGR